MLKESKEFLDKGIDNFTKKEVKELQKLISYHSDLYYNKQNPIISDFEYDELFKKLTVLEKKFKIKNKETKKVWAIVIESTFKKVEHSRPMISLDNTYNEEDLNNFDTRIKKLTKRDDSLEYTLEFKFDWLWIELIYKDWVLVQAITRWDWVKWEDVTQNIMQIDNIPKVIDYKKPLEVRGEVVLPISVFEELNKKAKIEWTKVFSNPRNAAAWSIRMKDNSVTKERKLKFFAYDLANFKEFSEVEDKEYYFDVIKDLEIFWFEISSYFIKLNWVKDVIKAIDTFWDIKKTIDFEIDWLVLKLNNLEFWKIVWSTEHHPRYAIAYKFPAEILTTKVLSVEHQVWRTGTITPVANLEPININWAIIRRATLHNYLEVKNLDVRVWDSVFIKRAWEVIPKIISVIKEGRIDWSEKIIAPSSCPSCDTEVIKDWEKVRFYCPNFNSCPAQIWESLAYSVWKQGFNIDWLWERQIKIFLENWVIKNLFDIFKIEEKREEILELEWFQEKSVNNLINSIENSKNIGVEILLTSIWINWVWKKTAKVLKKIFLSKDDLINFSYNLEDLEELPDIWPEIALNVFTYFTDNENKEFLNKLEEVLCIKYYEELNTNNNTFFSWKKVCITWSFENHKRDDLAKSLEENWWEFMSSVSKKTDYLLAWEKAGSKLKKANELGVEVLNIDNFLEKIKKQ